MNAIALQEPVSKLKEPVTDCTLLGNLPYRDITASCQVEWLMISKM